MSMRLVKTTTEYGMKKSPKVAKSNLKNADYTITYKNGSVVTLMGKTADHTVRTAVVRAKSSTSAISKFKKSKFFMVKTAKGTEKRVDMSVHVITASKTTPTVTVIPSKVPASHFHNFFGRSK